MSWLYLYLGMQQLTYPDLLIPLGMRHMISRVGRFSKRNAYILFWSGKDRQALQFFEMRHFTFFQNKYHWIKMKLAQLYSGLNSDHPNDEDQIPPKAQFYVQLYITCFLNRDTITNKDCSNGKCNLNNDANKEWWIVHIDSQIPSALQRVTNKYCNLLI